VIGDSAWRLVLHEIGHTMGLKHGHELGGVSGIAVPADRDSNEFTVMTYRKYIGADPAGDSGADVEQFGFAQSLMMLDIAALQYMYGANFSTNSGDTTYTFDPFGRSGNAGGQPDSPHHLGRQWHRYIRSLELRDSDADRSYPRGMVSLQFRATCPA
jgi:serralysin